MGSSSAAHPHELALVQNYMASKADTLIQAFQK